MYHYIILLCCLFLSFFWLPFFTFSSFFPFLFPPCLLVYHYNNLYKCYVDHIFVLFKLNDLFQYFQKFLNSCHIMFLSMETEKQNKFSFLNIEVICKQGKFSTTIYLKPIFSSMYINFGSFLPSIYKFGMAYTLVYRFFHIYSNWTKFHAELNFLKKYFIKIFPKMVILKTLLISVLKCF